MEKNTHGNPCPVLGRGLEPALYVFVYFASHDWKRAQYGHSVSIWV